MNKATKTRDKPAVEPRASSIPQFCQAYGISRASFYNLAKAGNAPDTISVGRRRIITNESAKKWEAAMAANSQAEAA